MSEWTRRWIEAFGDPHGRDAARGEALLRSGRVSEVRVEPGLLVGSVQGTRATPFVVEVRVPLLDDDAWDFVAGTVAGQVRHSARLLAGQAPEGLADELAEAGVRLLPAGEEIDGTCCGEPACAHRWAVWLSAARRIEQDPFLVLLLRGRGRQRLLEEVARRRGTAGGPAEEVGLPLEALDSERWWQSHAPLDGLPPVAPVTPRVPAPALLALGEPPGWAGGVGPYELFRPLVQQAARWALELLDVAGAEGAGDPRR